MIFSVNQKMKSINSQKTFSDNLTCKIVRSLKRTATYPGLTYKWTKLRDFRPKFLKSNFLIPISKKDTTLPKPLFNSKIDILIIIGTFYTSLSRLGFAWRSRIVIRGTWRDWRRSRVRFALIKLKSMMMKILEIELLNLINFKELFKKFKGISF